LFADITYHNLETFRNHLKEKPKRGTGGGRRSVRAVNVEIDILGQLFRKAYEWGMCAANPFDRGESLKLEGENHRTKWLDEKQIARLLLAAAPYLQPIIKTAIYLGTRSGKETLGLKWKDVDFEKGVVHVKRSKQRNGAVRVDAVPMCPDLEALFRSLKPENASAETHVFLYKGSPIKKTRRALRTACKKANIPYGLNVEGGLVFHDLRHTCATHLMARGANLKQVQEHLGHKNISTTSRYLHSSEEAKKQTANLLTGITSSVAVGGK
jgi:integrase